MRSLYSGVSGIRSHQTRMDVIGNNIANVNTTGFKASRVTFTDVFNQTLSSGSVLSNPQQIGLGVAVGSTDLITDDGAFQMTGRSLDLAISGAGLFVLKGANGEILYSRAGAFDWNAEGYLFSPALGMKVQGWMADADGVIGRADRATMTDIRMIRGDVSLPVATTQATFKGNLDASAPEGYTYETVLNAYDSLGRDIAITIRFTKGSGNTWEVEYLDPYDLVSDPDDPTDPTDPSDPTDLPWQAGITLTFNEKGQLDLEPSTDPDEPLPGTMTITIEDDNGQAAPLTIRIDFSKITQTFDGSGPGGTARSSVELDTRDGRRMGTLEAVYVNELGQITGRYTNGDSKLIAQIALANFNNVAGLIKEGNSTFAESPASGVPQIGTPASGGRGSLVPGNLEGSNVDLAGQFTEMILTQRGYQASAKLVSTADDMLQEIINLKR
uniref:flagellar hook protein FlgE n=1 Tax=Symbiobacterium terraclitae TaxID=557451 RepID=UPI0035B54A58